MVKGMTEQHSMSLLMMSLCVSEVFFQRGCWILQRINVMRLFFKENNKAKTQEMLHYRMV